MRMTGLAAMFLLALPVAAAQEKHGDADGAPVEHVHAPAIERPADYDLTFLAHMIVHHQQAVDMAALVAARSDRDELIKFARQIDGAQRSEIDHMRSLLDLAIDRGRKEPAVDVANDPPMQGMLSKRQMADLMAASGPQFERLWLQGMIYHHHGALAMARMQQEWEFANGRSDRPVDVMADHILDTQRAEIQLMERWLAEWELQDPRVP